MSAQTGATIEIRLANDLREIAGAAARIDGFCADLDISPDIAYAVNLALEELLSNTIGYGYGDDEPHRIAIVARLEEETLAILVVDDAAPFDPTEPPGKLPEESGAGGLGLLLVNRMMDGIAYRRRAGCNIVTLTKSTASKADS